MKVHHCGVVDGQAADDADQVEPLLLYEALRIIETSLSAPNRNSLTFFNIHCVSKNRQVTLCTGCDPQVPVHQH